MKVLKLSLVLAASTLCSLAQADFIGLTGDVSYWSYDGKVNTQKPDVFNQSLDRDGAAQISLAFEHPVPFIPNAKIKYVNLNSDGKNQAATNTRSTVDVSHTDYILYYEILDNVVSADIGLGLANLDGDIKLNQAVGYTHYNISGNQAIVYAAVGAKLPFTGFSAKAEAVYSHYSDVKLTDLQAEVQYDFIKNLVVDVGAKVGYRYTDINFSKEKNQDLSFEFKGPYVGVNVHF